MSMVSEYDPYDQIRGDSHAEEVFHALVNGGLTMENAIVTAEAVSKKASKDLLESAFAEIINKSVKHSSVALPSIDVKVKMYVNDRIKDIINNAYPGFDVEFLTPDGVFLSRENRTSLGARRSMPDMKSKEGVDEVHPTRSYAHTSHELAYVNRAVVEAILLRKIPLNEGYNTLNMPYDSFLKRGAKAHCCYQTRPFEGYVTDHKGDMIPKYGGSWENKTGKTITMEAGLREYDRFLQRKDKKRTHPIFKEIDYRGVKTPRQFENVALEYRCFQAPEVCEIKRDYGITAFTAKEFTVERLVKVMHNKNMKVLYGAEPLCKAMLRRKEGVLPLFEQRFVTDLKENKMYVYNTQDNSIGYQYKYSDIRDYFFERDLVHEGRVYSFRHEYCNDSVIQFAIRRMPKGTVPSPMPPVVDMWDDTVFLRTYDFSSAWHRNSTRKLEPVLFSCSATAYNHMLNFLTNMDKPNDEFMVTAARSLRSINSELVINGKGYENFEKVPTERLNQIAIAILIETIKIKMINNAVIGKVFDNTEKVYKKRTIFSMSANVLLTKLSGLFTSNNSFSSVVDSFHNFVISTWKDKLIDKAQLVEFFSYSHFVTNPYGSDYLKYVNMRTMTPFEALWKTNLSEDDEDDDVRWFRDVIQGITEYDPDSLVHEFFGEADIDAIMDDMEDLFFPDVQKDDIEEEEDIGEFDKEVFEFDSAYDSDVEKTGCNADVVGENLRVSTINLPVLKMDDICDVELVRSVEEKSEFLSTYDFDSVFSPKADSSLSDEQQLRLNMVREAFIYRKCFSSCVVNDMRLNVPCAFEGGVPQKLFFDNEKKKKAGFAALRFKDGVQVSSYGNIFEDKNYVMGFKSDSSLPLEECYHILTFDRDTKVHYCISNAGTKFRKKIMYSGYLLVNDDTSIMNDEVIAEKLNTYDVNYDLPEEVTLVNAAAGVGKTFEIVKNFSPKNFFVGSTKKVVAELREKLRDDYGKKFAGFDFKNRIRTVDSINVNGVKLREPVDELIFDECFQVHPGEILCVINQVRPNRVRMYGDSMQIRFIDRLRIRDMVFAKLLEKLTTKMQFKADTWRCPLDATRVLSDNFYEKEYGVKFRTNSKQLYSIEKPILVSSEQQVPFFRNVLYLTFTNADAYTLNKYFKFKYGKLKKETMAIYGEDDKKFSNDPNNNCVMTVHRAQGLDVKHVIVVRLSKNMEKGPMSPAHLLVAMSRHRNSIQYLSKDVDDDFGRLFNYALNSKKVDYGPYKWKYSP